VTGAAAESIVAMVLRIASMETLDHPDPETVAKLIGGGAIVSTESPSSLEVKTSATVCSSRQRPGDQRAHRAKRRPTTQTSAAVIGAPETIIESKTSHAIFELVQHGRPVLGFPLRIHAGKPP
jgi:hypothetical protein